MKSVAPVSQAEKRLGFVHCYGAIGDGCALTCIMLDDFRNSTVLCKILIVYNLVCLNSLLTHANCVEIELDSFRFKVLSKYTI